MSGFENGREPSVSLAKVLETRFRGDIRFRGQAYVSGERVEITHVTEERVYGVVHDGQEFQTQLSREESRLVTFCTWMFFCCTSLILTVTTFRVCFTGL